VLLGLRWDRRPAVLVDSASLGDPSDPGDLIDASDLDDLDVSDDPGAASGAGP
jgi:hypothetical protein